MQNATEMRNYVEKAFPERLKQLRQAIGVSQDELAKALGVSRASIGYYESGSRLPDIGFLAVLANRTGCDVNYFLGGSENMVPNMPDFAERFHLGDDQYGALLDLLGCDSFCEALRRNLFYFIFHSIDAMASYGLGYPNLVTAPAVAELVAADFKDAIVQIYTRLDNNQRIQHKLEIDMIKSDDLSELQQKKADSLSKLVSSFYEHAAKLNERKSEILNPQRLGRIFFDTTKTIEPIDDNLEEASQDPVEKFRNRLKELRDKGRKEHKSSWDEAEPQ